MTPVQFTIDGEIAPFATTTFAKSADRPEVGDLILHRHTAYRQTHLELFSHEVVSHQQYVVITKAWQLHTHEMGVTELVLCYGVALVDGGPGAGLKP